MTLSEQPATDQHTLPQRATAPRKAGHTSHTAQRPQYKHAPGRPDTHRHKHNHPHTSNTVATSGFRGTATHCRQARSKRSVQAIRRKVMKGKKKHIQYDTNKRKIT